MLKKVLRLRRDGEVINETRPVLRKVKKARTVKVKASRWGQVSMSDQRASVPCPTRKNLTTVQWAELGDCLRVLRRYGYVNADTLSLAESRDAILSIQRCSLLRFMAQA